MQVLEELVRVPEMAGKNGAFETNYNGLLVQVVKRNGSYRFTSGEMDFTVEKDGVLRGYIAKDLVVVPPAEILVRITNTGLYGLVDAVLPRDHPMRDITGFGYSVVSRKKRSAKK